MADAKVRVTVMRKRDLGGRVGEIMISLQSEDYVGMNDVMVTSIPLIDKADQILDGWLAANNIQPHANGADLRRHPAERITVEVKDGKTYYKVKGGEFSEHGINFWPEHMKQCGIDPRKIKNEGYTLKEGCQMEVEYIFDKPKRVIRLISAQQNG